jgi:transcriptional regulator
MYVPKHFAVTDIAACHKVITENSFGELVSVDADGAPFASHLPFLLDPQRGASGTLIAHMARANPQWRHFTPGKPVLAVFRGPHAYVSPAWYATHPSVPTWNYVAVHAYGTPAIVEEPNAVRDILWRLVDLNEAANGTDWRMGGLKSDYLAGMMRAIVAFELPIAKLEGKAKLSQNRDATDQARVVAALEQSDDPAAKATAAAMRAVVPT